MRPSTVSRICQAAPSIVNPPIRISLQVTDTMQKVIRQVINRSTTEINDHAQNEIPHTSAVEMHSSTVTHRGNAWHLHGRRNSARLAVNILALLETFFLWFSARPLRSSESRDFRWPFDLQIVNPERVFQKYPRLQPTYSYMRYFDFAKTAKIHILPQPP